VFGRAFEWKRSEQSGMRLRREHGVDIFYAVAVNCIWGLAFVIPTYLKEADPTLVAFGRYFIYGVVSAGILFAAVRAVSFARIPWIRAFAYAFMGHVGYYIVLVWAISMGGVLVVAPIMATLPVSVAVVGNALDRELEFRRLIFPLLFIIVGITYLRIYQNSELSVHAVHVRNMIYGALLAFGALSMWTMYAVLNARYLKRSRISSMVWAQAMGLCCLLQVGIVLSLWLFLHERPAELFEWTASNELILKFVAGILVLGVAVSWLATQVWNRVSRKLPIAVAGQLLVVQSLAAIAYGSWLDRQIPHAVELICVVLVVVGVVWGVKVAYEPNANTLSSVRKNEA
jgi:drug/metabolite transporter (DMT)-like permease